MKTMCPGYHDKDFGNSSTWEHDVRFICPSTHELPQSHCGDNQEGTLGKISKRKKNIKEKLICLPGKRNAFFRQIEGRNCP